MPEISQTISHYSILGIIDQDCLTCGDRRNGAGFHFSIAKISLLLRISIFTRLRSKDAWWVRDWIEASGVLQTKSGGKL
jgi:hypothetical protein